MYQEPNRGNGNRGNGRAFRGQRGGNRGFRAEHRNQEFFANENHGEWRGRGRPPMRGGANRGRGEGHNRQPPAAAAHGDDWREPGPSNRPWRASSSQPPHFRNVFISFSKLRLMEETVTDDTASEIMLDKSGFPQAMNDENLYSKPDAFEMMISIVVKSIAHDPNAENSLLLLSKVMKSAFLTSGFTNYYSKLLTRVDPFESKKAKEAFVGSVKILRTILERFPSNLELVIPAYSMVNIILSQNKPAFDPETKRSVDVMSLIIQNAKKKSPSKEEEEEEEKEKWHNRHPSKPPDDFRTMGIFPSFDKDLAYTHEPFLRPIQVKGGFEDVEHYLDVHFRLLREDFVGPLRKGIKEYLELTERNQPNKKTTEVRVYKSVKILNPLCQQSGLIYRVQFDADGLKRVNWATTKRFIFGSLLCLSANNFESVAMATVEDRKPEDLANGIVHVKFEDDTDPLKFDDSSTFVMLETTAFFEAYRHVLECLVAMDPETFPFRDYIVHCQQTVKPPAYLASPASRFFELEATGGGDVVVITDEEVPPSRRDALKIDVLNPWLWPSAATLGLDESQLTALRTSLTSELSVVQGPPGTGKTFLGLRIVEILLKNWKVWNADGRPILVVCYTNHALDQFLEGIHKFLKSGIVRIGGRSKSAVMKEFNLSQLRYESRSKRNVPKEIFGRKHDVLREMKLVQDKIDKIGAKIEAMENGIIDESQLAAHMSQEQLDSLRLFSIRGASSILQWLQINNTGDDLGIEAAEQGLRDALPVGTKFEEEEDENLEMENEADLEEHMRRMENMDVEMRLKRLEEAKRKNEIKREAEKNLAFNLNQIRHDNNEWETQRNQRRGLKKKLKRCITDADAMSESDAARVRNVWDLHARDKWRLYRHWLNKLKMHLKLGIAEETGIYNLLCRNLKTIQSSEDEWIMREAKVIGMTTTCAARSRKILSAVRARVVVVEEAAEVLESHVVASLNHDCQHLVLIGDHLQLRPSPNVHRLGTRYHLDCSLFERLVLNGFPFVTLEKQHRMRPEISDFARITYPQLRDDDSVTTMEDVKGVASNVFFINHHQPETKDGELKSAFNTHEAAFLARLCKYLLQQGYAREQITILTPYSGQMFELRKHLPKNFFQGVRVCPVDNYQGEENDIILLSLVRSNYEEKIGFLKDSNRLNVAMTRAKRGLYVIGNFDMLKDHSDFVRKVYTKVIESERPTMGTRLPLSCQNHPGRQILAATARDFDQAPEGGCLLPCRFRLPCGHTCTRACHPYDRSHAEFQCLKPCQKVMQPCQHPCSMKCFEPCGKCQVVVERIVQRCGHLQKMKCHVLLDSFVCREKCKHLLPCGHPCAEACGKEHTVECEAVVTRSLDCGHLANVPCHQNRDDVDVACRLECAAVLDCGHTCSGTCADCFAGRVHLGCSKRCAKNLICGHECRSPCSVDCPPCDRRCDIKCSHNDCSKLCGQACAPCNEPCSWNCRHRQCSRLCHEQCDRGRCDVPCCKQLKCGHPCVGLCGETCPRLCRVCHAEELTEVFFGDEDEPNARFVQLVDCGHVLEVRGLDRWVDERGRDGSAAIVQLCCPRCKTPIKNNDRYRPEIKSIQAKIDKVKAKIRGSDQELHDRRCKIFASLREIKGARSSWVTKASESIAADNIGLGQLEKIRCAVQFAIHLDKLSCKTPREHSYVGRMRDRIMDNPGNLTNQECEEFQFEISRLRLLKAFLDADKLVRGSSNPRMTQNDKQDFSSSLSSLQACKLDPEKEDKFENILKRTRKLIGGLGISDAERLAIVGAMDVQRGAWFECPNGHVYAIGDCGGAQVVGRCNECGEAIGGTNHALRVDNRFNGAMDGASRTAWPGTAMNPNRI